MFPKIKTHKLKSLFVGINFIIAFVAFLGLIVFNSYYDTIIKNEILKDNKISLERFKKCFNSFDDDVDKKIAICMQGSLTTKSSDAFVVSLKDMRIVWGNGINFIKNKSYLTKEGICSKATDVNSCINFANLIRKGYNNSYIWRFEQSPEYDTWIIIPDETKNIDGTLRSECGLKEQYAVVQRTKLNEVNQSFHGLKIIVNVILSLIIFLNILGCFVFSKFKVCNMDGKCNYQI